MNLQKKVEVLIRESGKMKRWHKVVTALACVVVFCTTYALILPAVTMERETYCGYTEHTHSQSCYSQVLVCDLEEGENHTHTEDCYEQQLTCGMDEHSHVLSCYSNPYADVEEAADWEQTLDDIELTDDLAANVTAIANSQAGYEESEKNYAVMEDGETMKGYTRYGAWYGDAYADWDGMFVSFCLYYAGVPSEDMPLAHDCAEWADVLSDRDLYVSPEGSSSPDGTRENPYGTLEAARDAVRKMDKTGLTGIDVVLLPGTYSLTGTFALSAEDKGSAECRIRYIGEDGATIVGGAALTAADFSKVDFSNVQGDAAYIPESSREKIVMIDLKQFGYMPEDIKQAYEGSYVMNAVKLYLNGEMEKLALTKPYVQILELDFVEGNTRARALYEKMGYKITGRRPSAICLKDGTLLDEYMMQKKIKR